jgi:hypothetical protein
MPETPVDKQSKLALRHNEIRTPGKILRMPPEADAQTTKQLFALVLRTGSDRAHRAHNPATLRLGKHINHLRAGKETSEILCQYRAHL